MLHSPLDQNFPLALFLPPFSRWTVLFENVTNYLQCTVFKKWLALATDNQFDRIRARKRVQIVVEGLVEG
jgi:hypothetical protein